jgi:hypothetical protein
MRTSQKTPETITTIEIDLGKGSSDQRGDAIVCGLGERFSCQSR